MGCNYLSLPLILVYISVGCNYLSLPLTPPKWGPVCPKQVSRAGTSNYIPQILWDVITCPCPWHLLLAHKSSYSPWDIPYIPIDCSGAVWDCISISMFWLVHFDRYHCCRIDLCCFISGQGTRLMSPEKHLTKDLWAYYLNLEYRKSYCF